MKIFDYATRPAADVASGFGVQVSDGLDEETVSRRITEFGSNRLVIKEINSLHILLRQFRSAFIYLLLAAMIITLFLGEIVDVIMIFLFIAINAILGFYQEYSSEKTAQLLNSYALPRARALRGGVVRLITADQLVPGDIVMLETGDRVPADLRLLAENNLTIDETVLTGESAPVFKQSEILETIPDSYHEAVNLAFSGTDVLKGQGKGIVVSTGRNTAFGQIAKLAGESRKVSDFEKGISQFSQYILKLVGITLLVVIGAHLLISRDGVDVFELIVFSVALTVSVIPEALPLVTTFSLARGAKRLAKRKVIVKRLSAIEDLGGIEILCSDKTGTLTENKLSIANVYSDDREQAIWMANLASSFELRKKIEPFDIALEKGLSSGQKKKLHKVTKISEEPFDPQTRRNSVLVKDGDQYQLIVRGAPEAIAELCFDMDPNIKAGMNDWIRGEGMKGHRVLAVGYKELMPAGMSDEFYERELDRKDFTFSGFISFVDPIKKSSFSAFKSARKLGVRIVIITGDSPEVAGAVAVEIGLIDAPGKVITGKDWQTANRNQREEYLEQYSVFARISPGEKFDIIQHFREHHMIGFLGEGINDAPALKVAGVSLVVDSAADIAREASDIILLEKDLGVIMDGVREGREVFANTTKYIKSTLASNFGNFFAVASASLMIDFLPMLPIQILLVNLLSDTPMISISTDRVESGELKSPRKYQAREIIIIAMVLGMISMVFDFMFFGLFYRISAEVLQTNWFIGSILTELVLLFSIRTRSIFYKAVRPSKYIVSLSMITVVLTVGLPFTTFGQQVFKFVPPQQGHLAMILLVVILYFIVTETVKLLYYRNSQRMTG